jgi:3-hydroxyisobutyrate dehydrogenase
MVFVDAPVLGTKQPAEEGKLVILASGPDDAQERARPVFEAIGQRTTWLGEAGQGSKLKLVVNNWILAVVEGVAETFALADALGLDGNLFLETIKGGGVDIPYAHAKGTQILARSFPPSFPLRLAEKDARLVLEAAAAAGQAMPLTETVRAQFRRAIELGHGEEDMIATFFASHE